MELEIAKNAIDYRLIFFQPDPESGERVCVAVMVGDELLYDDRFSRARCLARETDPQILRFYLGEMKESIRGGHSAIEVALQSYAPLFATSSPRKISLPVTESKKLSLLNKFVLRVPAVQRPQRTGTSEHRRAFVGRLREFADATEKSLFDEVIEDARPVDVIGTPEPRIRRVALALKKKFCTFLIDGVDLNLYEPEEALGQSNRVTHTFWQYKRLTSGRADRVRRIGIVINGASGSRPEYRDVHDFALEQFNNEADLAIDASVGDPRVRWRQFIESECAAY